MEQTEVRKEFRGGFLFSEEAMRRTLACIDEHAARTHGSPEAVCRSYELRLENGYIIEGDDWEEIFAGDNAGGRTPVSIGIKAETEDVFSIRVNMDVSDRDVRLVVRGSRSWAVVCAAELDDRISGCQVRDWTGWLRRDVTPTLMLAVMVPIAVVLYLFSVRQSECALDQLRTLEREWTASPSRDVGRLVLDLANLSFSSQHRQISNFWITVAPLPIMLVVLMLFAWLSVTLQKITAYGFCWGDNARVLQKRQAIWRFIGGTVVVGLAVSILGGIVTALLLR